MLQLLLHQILLKGQGPVFRGFEFCRLDSCKVCTNIFEVDFAIRAHFNQFLKRFGKFFKIKFAVAIQINFIKNVSCKLIGKRPIPILNQSDKLGNADGAVSIYVCF